MSKPGGWPGVGTGETDELDGIGKTDCIGAKGDTDEEEDGKELCSPWKFAKATEVREPALALVVTKVGGVDVTR